ncbi:MAG: LysR family transcriptional regulator [Alkalispirochaeta sp.]
MIERIHLEMLTLVQRLGTVARVADELHRTQPTITHAIKKLESELGVTLWRKQGRGIELTHAGEHVARRGAPLLTGFSRLERDVAGFAAGRRGTLRIGVECHPCFHWLSGVVGSFLRRWPDVDVDVIRDYQFSGYEALVNRQVDLVVTPDPRRIPGVVSTPVLPYELVVVVDARHPLAEKTVLVPEDLAAETLYTYPVDRGRLDIFTRFLSPAGIEPHRVETIETTEIMLQLVAAGRGVTAVPDWLAEDAGDRADGSDLVRLRIGEGIPKELVVSHREEDASLVYLLDFISGASSRGYRDWGHRGADPDGERHIGP